MNKDIISFMFPWFFFRSLLKKRNINLHVNLYKLQISTVEKSKHTK